MFDSGDEDDYTFEDAPQDFQPSHEERYYQENHRSYCPPSQSINNHTREASNEFDDDEDPFRAYPNANVYTGFIVTSTLSPNENREFSHFVYQPGASSYRGIRGEGTLYGIPRHLTTPPSMRSLPAKKQLNAKGRWAKKWDLDFGREIDYILDDHDRVLTYKKGSSDAIPSEVIDSNYVFKDHIVLDSSLKTVFASVFGTTILDEPLSDCIANLVYEAYIKFDIKRMLQKQISYTIFKLLNVSPDQALAHGAPWIKVSKSTVKMDEDGLVEQVEEANPLTANVLGLTYRAGEVLHVNHHMDKPIMFGLDFDKQPPIGTFFQMDYVRHPFKNWYFVTAVIKPMGDLDVQQIADDEYIFKITLDVSQTRNGYFTHASLGMVADPRGCLRFIPYAHNRSGNNEFEVFVAVTRKEPAKFEIVELTEETEEKSKNYEPKEFRTPGLVVHPSNGRIFSPDYPSLDLRIPKSKLSNFAFGEFVEGKFRRANPYDKNDHRFIAFELFKVATPPLLSTTLTNNYGLIMAQVKEIEYRAPPSKKQLKTGVVSADVVAFPQYHHFFQGFFETTHGGLISGSKGRLKSSQQRTLKVILETSFKPGSQTLFNYVKVPEHGLDLEKDKALADHVQKVLAMEQAQNSVIIDLNEEPAAAQRPTTTPPPGFNPKPSSAAPVSPSIASGSVKTASKSAAKSATFEQSKSTWTKVEATHHKHDKVKSEATVAPSSISLDGSANSVPRGWGKQVNQSSPALKSPTSKASWARDSSSAAGPSRAPWAAQPTNVTSIPPTTRSANDESEYPALGQSSRSRTTSARTNSRATPDPIQPEPTVINRQTPPHQRSSPQDLQETTQRLSQMSLRQNHLPSHTEVEAFRVRNQCLYRSNPAIESKIADILSQIESYRT